jgi:hypothetical protein
MSKLFSLLIKLQTTTHPGEIDDFSDDTDTFVDDSDDESGEVTVSDGDSGFGSSDG